MLVYMLTFGVYIAYMDPMGYIYICMENTRNFGGESIHQLTRNWIY